MKMYPYTFSGLPAVQVQTELESFLYFIKSQNISSYLEIGVGRGDTFHVIMSSLPKCSRGVAVDLPESCWGLDKSHNYLDAAIKNLSESYNATAIYGSSQDENIAYLVKSLAPFDLVFIDGDHSYNGVKADFENYGHLGKIVAFHDIADSMRPNLKGEVIEVPVFWNEIKKNYRHIEFIEPKSTMGIGVIFMD